MVDAVNVPVQTVAANGPVLFASTRLRTGCATRHEAGSSRIVLLSPGVYRVSFSGNVSIPTGGTVQQTSVSVIQDGEAIPGSTMLYTPAAVAVPGNIATDVLVRVYQCCANSTLSVRNTGADTINIQDANIVVTRES